MQVRQDEKISTGGQWAEWEQEIHINILELKAALFGIKSLAKGFSHIRLMIDNTTAVAYINKMGGTKSKACNELAQQIWQWAISTNTWLSAAHIPGMDNVGADFQSRNFSIQKSSEWTLAEHVFERYV